MKEEKINIKKLDKKATIPTYGSDYAAGADLYACLSNTEIIEPGETKFIKTGLSFEIPIGLVGLVFARSGLSCKQGLAPANKVGVIDSDYRGEVMVALYNQSKEIREVNDGDRIAQIAFIPYVKGLFNEVDNLNDTIRGKGGFGSTGTK
jgi:dUTP pyrophosphatase